MKPEQFIRWFGIEDAKYLIEQNINCNDFKFSLEDLKRLVESLDLIEKVGGIKRAKELLELFEDRKGRADNYMPLFRAVQVQESIYGEEQ